jgi:hypothetical protein
MLHVPTRLHLIKHRKFLSIAKMSELVSQLNYATTTRRRSARLSSVGGDSTPKPTLRPRKRKRLEDNELTSSGIQGQRDSQIPDPPTLELSPKEQRKSRKRKANEFPGSMESLGTFPALEPELQPNPTPVYLIPDVEKKEINFHGRLGMSGLWNEECMKLTSFHSRLCLSEHRPSNKETRCWFDLLFKNLPVSSKP